MLLWMWRFRLVSVSSSRWASVSRMFLMNVMSFERLSSNVSLSIVCSLQFVCAIAEALRLFPVIKDISPKKSPSSSVVRVMSVSPTFFYYVYPSGINDIHLFAILFVFFKYDITFFEEYLLSCV